MASAKSCCEQQTERRLRVLDLAGLNLLQSLREQHRLQFEKFIRFMLSLSGSQSGCHEEVNSFVGESGGRIHCEEVLHTLRGAARLLLQLPQCAVTSILPGIQPPGWDLIQVALSRISILPDQQDLGVGSSRVADEGNHGAGTWMTHNLHLPDRPVRESNRIHVERYDLAGVDASGRYLPGTIFSTLVHLQASWTVTSPRSVPTRELRTIPASPTTTV
jgi:hypothetical protein